MLRSHSYFIFKVELALWHAVEEDPMESVRIQVAVSNPSLTEKLNMELNKMYILYEGDQSGGRYNTELALRIAAEFEYEDIHDFFLQLCAAASDDWRESYSPTKEYFEGVEGPRESDSEQDEDSSSWSEEELHKKKKQKRSSF